VEKKGEGVISRSGQVSETIWKWNPGAAISNRGLFNRKRNKNLRYLLLFHANCLKLIIKEYQQCYYSEKIKYS